MRLTIPKDMFDNYIPPQILLCNTDKEIMGELLAYDVQLNAKWNTYSELSFSIDRMYVDVLTGETKVHPLFDKVEGLRKVYIRDMGYFVIQDSNTSLADKDTKTVSCFSIEYETGQKYLENFFINTGGDDSVEVTYYANQFGEDYFDQDNLYKLTSGSFDAYEKYYIREYKDEKSYVYEQTTILNEEEYQKVYENLYVKTYSNVRFYWPTKPELSLLHLIFAKIPEWKIANVDRSLWYLERKFEETRVSVYDFLTNKVCDTFKCVIEWDTIKNEVYFYEEDEDGITDEENVQTRFDTDIYISKENLANEIQITYSTDDIKTKLKVSGADSLDIREINLGQNYILNLDYYDTQDWFGEDLYNAWQQYKTLLEEQTPIYSEQMSKWAAAYNVYSDLVNAVPESGNVLLVGDIFTKLYCTYVPIVSADASVEDIQDAISNSLKSLMKWLDIYGVKKDTNGVQTDNVLLTLKGVDSDSRAVIRVYYDKDILSYRVRVQITDEVGSIATIHYSLREWVNTGVAQTNLDKLPPGTVKASLVSSYIFSEGVEYKIASIGTLGAYLCLATDETRPENLQDYGIRLLEEKEETYTTIFLAQTEENLAREDAKCIAGTETEKEALTKAQVNKGTMFFATDTMTLYECTNNTSSTVQWSVIEVASDSAPTNPNNGQRWLDTSDINNPVLKEYTSTGWVPIKDESARTPSAQDYTRYIENYNKLQTINDVLKEKKKAASLYLDGILCPHPSLQKRNIGSMIQNDVINYLKTVAIYCLGELAGYSWQLGETTIKQILEATDPIIFGDYDVNIYALPLSWKGIEYVIYSNGTNTYLSFSDAQGICSVRMNYIKNITSMESNFTEGQWMRLSPFIREDEYTDSNFALTGYESEEDRLKICKELLEAAQKELKKLCQPSLEFSVTMANILAIPEFRPLLWQFKLGNFVRVGIREDYIKRARLLEVHLSFEDISDFSCSFGNLVTTKSEVDKHAELLQQAVSAGKTVANSASNWQKGADKATALDKAITEGLRDAALEIGATSGQAIKWDETGIWGRKLQEGTTDQYEDEQFRMSNNKLVFTNDNWATTKSVIGKFTVDGEERWGLLSDAVVSGYIEGSVIKGGSLEIGGTGGRFIVNEDGSVQIMADNNQEKYASTSDLEVIREGLQYRIELSYSGSTVFASSDDSTTITARVFKGETDITDQIQGKSTTTFSWIRSSANNDSDWNAANANKSTNIITITASDVAENALFSCKVQFDETKL